VKLFKQEWKFWVVHVADNHHLVVSVELLLCSRKFPSLVSEHQQVVVGQECVVVSAWSISRNPDEFVKAAIAAGHPCKIVLPEAIRHAIGTNASASSADLARQRALFFHKWTLLLWRELMIEFGYSDLEVRENVLGRCKPQGEEDATVHSKTLDERDKGWARGPIDRCMLGDDSLVSRRFGLKQGPKVRLIDDLTMGGVNELVTVHPKPHGLDIVAGMLLTCMKEMPGAELRGRAYDLRSAYRQLPVHLESLKHSFVAHWNAEAGAVEIDQLLALPFGASRSVFGFLRVATSVWWIGCMALGLIWSVFFDDFVTVARETDVRHTESAATALFRLLGWDYDDCGIKAVYFDVIFRALGVSFDLSSASRGDVGISNTESRIAELCQSIGEILDSRSLTRAAALRLRGRMQFCDSFLFGRASRLCLQAVTLHAYGSPDAAVDDDLWISLFRFRDCLAASRPHLVSSRHGEPLFVFTDACYEPGSEWCAGLGATLFDASGSFIAFFSFCLDKAGREVLGEATKKTIIFELEFLAVITALVQWKSHLKNRFGYCAPHTGGCRRDPGMVRASTIAKQCCRSSF
ncbi:unnamed protein product, partial [Symbiodinium sp. CCMP2456]